MPAKPCLELTRSCGMCRLQLAEGPLSPCGAWKQAAQAYQAGPSLPTGFQ